MFRVLVIFFIFNFYSPAYSSTKEKIISQMQYTNNLSFNFTQTIGDKNENGQCIIKCIRVWVHTCSLDHKNALPNYQSRGMKIFKSETLIR